MLYPEVPDHPIPVRFLFVLLNSVDNYPGETLSIGRTMGALFSDEVNPFASDLLQISISFPSPLGLPKGGPAL
jgi:hypothetical protein